MYRPDLRPHLLHATHHQSDPLLELRQPGHQRAIVFAGSQLSRQQVQLALPTRQVVFQGVPLRLQFRRLPLPLLPRLLQDAAQQGGVVAGFLDLLDDQGLDLGRGDGLRRAGVPAPLLRPDAGVVAVAPPALG
jgi:hypothetical protein